MKATLFTMLFNFITKETDGRLLETIGNGHAFGHISQTNIYLFDFFIVPKFVYPRFNTLTIDATKETHCLRLSLMTSKVSVTSSANCVIKTSGFLAVNTLMRRCRETISHLCDTSSVVLLCNK